MSSANKHTNLRPQVLGFPIDLVDKTEALNIIAKHWQTNTELHVVTVNAEMVIAAQQDHELAKIIRQSKLNIADGAGIVIALRLHGYKTVRLPGIELARASLQEAAKNNIAVALIGSDPEIIDYLSHTLPKEVPGLNLVFCQDGYFNQAEEEKIVAKIEESQAQLVLVAMGVPKQEYFIEKVLGTVKHVVLIGVGGSFDIWSGKKQRAPQIWQRYHLEWLYRLIKEPWRLKRTGTTLPKFVYQVFRDCLTKLLAFKKDNA